MRVAEDAMLVRFSRTILVFIYMYIEVKQRSAECVSIFGLEEVAPVAMP